MSRRYNISLSVTIDDDVGLVEFAQRRSDHISPEPDGLEGREATVAALTYLVSVSDLAAIVDQFGSVDGVYGDSDSSVGGGNGGSDLPLPPINMFPDLPLPPINLFNQSVWYPPAIYVEDDPETVENYNRFISSYIKAHVI